MFWVTMLVYMLTSSRQHDLNLSYCLSAVLIHNLPQCHHTCLHSQFKFPFSSTTFYWFLAFHLRAFPTVFPYVGSWWHISAIVFLKCPLICIHFGEIFLQNIKFSYFLFFLRPSPVPKTRAARQQQANCWSPGTGAAWTTLRPHLFFKTTFFFPLITLKSLQSYISHFSVEHKRRSYRAYFESWCFSAV